MNVDIETITERKVTMVLTEREACAVMAVFGSVAGNGDVANITDKLYDLLDGNISENEYRDLFDSLTGTIQSEKIK